MKVLTSGWLVLNRPSLAGFHSPGDTQSAGFSNINLDFIYGLPTQTIEEWGATLETIGRLRPQSVSIHQLRVKPGTRMYDDYRNCLPDDEVRITMVAMAHVVLSGAGYRAIGDEGFVLAPEYDHQHQKDKWVRFKELLGVGPAAYGYLADTTCFNHLHEVEYHGAIETGRLPIWRAKKLSAEEQKARALVLGLTFREGLSVRLYESMFHEEVDAAFGPLIVRLESEGLLERVNGSIRLTVRGGFFSPEIRRQFFPSRDGGCSRYPGSYFREFAYAG